MTIPRERITGIKLIRCANPSNGLPISINFQTNHFNSLHVIYLQISTRLHKCLHNINETKEFYQKRRAPDDNNGYIYT